MSGISHSTDLLKKNRSILFNSGILAMSIMLLVFLGTDFYPIVFDGFGFVRKLMFFTLIPMLVITLIYFRHMINGALAGFEITCLLLLCLLSFFWSINAPNTVERVFPLFVITLFSLMIGSMTSLKGYLWILGWVGALIILFSVISIILLPHARGIPPWDNTWRGIFNHKNGLGAASVSAIIFLSAGLVVAKGRFRQFFKAMLLGAVILLVASESRSAQLFAIVSGTALVTAVVRKNVPVLWAVGFSSLLASVVLFCAWLLSSPLAEPVFDLIGRKPTLSSRIPLWELLWPYVQQEYWLGYGYSAFWHPGSPYPEIIANHPSLGFQPFYSHNGLLEVWLHIGFAGVFLLLLAIIRLFWSFYICFRYLKNPLALMILFVFLNNFFLLNITEGSLLARDNINWMVFVATLVRVNIVAKSLRTAGKTNRYQHSARPVATHRVSPS